MKKALLLLLCLAAMLASSTTLKVQELQIPIMPGCNWISIPGMDTLDFATALGSFTPVTGDVIQSQWGNVRYRNGQWKGNISQFYPGHGYKYNSNREMPVMLTLGKPLPQLSVATAEPTDITTSNAMVGGTVTVGEGNHIFTRGICWSTEPNPDIDGDHITGEAVAGNQSFTVEGLILGTTYYVRAYMVTDYGLAYGNEMTFTTMSGIPSVTTAAVTDITTNSAVCGGEITDDGGLEVTARGICWSTSPEPTIADAHTSEGDGIGSFVSTMTGLTPNTTYYVRAYATNSHTTAYGGEVSITTLPIPNYTVTVSANPAEGGTIVGGGTYEQGQTCTLTATANGGYTFTNWTENGEVVSTDATYTFTVTGDRTLVANFTANGGGGDHAYVDLGLPSGLLWATCNVGADNPEDYGDYFAWGETTPKENYNWGTYQYCNGSYNTLTKYCNDSSYGYNGFTDDLTTLLPEDDAATANYWGSGWRMPTIEEFQELYNNTTVTWTTLNGVNGRLFTAANGNSLFLPAAGYRWDGGLGYVGDLGIYWSSSLNTDYPYYAWYFNFTSGSYDMSYGNRFNGLSVRAVRSGQNNAPTGAINGKFTINADGGQVYFSQGNLQYQASTNTWRFADNQYDYVGSDNSNISSSYSGWIDLFGWGTSGWNSGNTYYQPWDSNNSDGSLYGPPGQYNLTGSYANADWGVYNPISNGGNTANQWRTLTQPEWNYVFSTRSTTSGIRYAKANVNNVNGVILLPDDWSSSTYSLSNTNSIGASFSSNTISASQWTTLESAGAVFLPAAGHRGGASVSNVDSFGGYWSASYSNSYSAYLVYFYDSDLHTYNGYNRCSGQSVRLVRVAEN